MLQHVFFQLYRCLPLLLTDVSLRGWLFQVAHNGCLDELRRKCRRREIAFSTIEWECGEEEISRVENIADSAPLPEEVAELIDLHTVLLQATSSLPPKFRCIVHMHCFKQLSFKEIGRMLSMPEPSVKSYYYRSLPLLRKKLTSERHVLAIS